MLYLNGKVCSKSLLTGRSLLETRISMRKKLLHGMCRKKEYRDKDSEKLKLTFPYKKKLEELV